MHTRRLLARALILFVLAALAAGCGRAVSVGSDARPVYRINVHNETGEAMIVSYDEGRGSALLGTVPAGRADSFVIAARTTTVNVTARNVAGTRVLPPITVQLSEASAQPVYLR
jgi:hypothetical protein